jgi:hypothetical protein
MHGKGFEFKSWLLAQVFELVSPRGTTT